MKVAVFGANGMTGIEVVKALISRSDEVVAAVRRPETMSEYESNPRVTIMKVDLSEPDTLRATITGCDAIVCALGTGSLKSSREPTTLYSGFVRSIRPIMRQCGVKRLVACSSGGTEEDAGAPWFYTSLLRRYVMNTYLDMLKMETILEETPDIDWTCVRLTYLRPKGNGTPYKVKDRKLEEGTFKISYADAADFIVNELHENKWVRKFPVISY